MNELAVFVLVCMIALSVALLFAAVAMWLASKVIDRRISQLKDHLSRD